MSHDNLNDVASMSIAAESSCSSVAASSAAAYARNDNPNSRSELINKSPIIDAVHGTHAAESVLFTPADDKSAMKVIVTRHERERERDTSVKFPLYCTLRVGKFPCELTTRSNRLHEYNKLTTSFSADYVLTDSWRNFALELNARVLSNDAWSGRTFPLRSCHRYNNNKFPLSQQRAKSEAEAHVVAVKYLLKASTGSVQAHVTANRPNIEDDAAKEVDHTASEVPAAQQELANQPVAKFPNVFMHTADLTKTFISSARSASAHANKAAECTMLEVLAQLAAIQQSQVPSNRTPTARVECATSTRARGKQFHKFPIIKKQFFNFPMRQIDADLHDMRVATTQVQATGHEIYNADDDNAYNFEGVQHIASDVEHMVGGDITPGDYQGRQTLNLNGQNFVKCVNFRKTKANAENASAAVTDRMAMVDMLAIKHQQAENFNDAFEICDAMKLRTERAKNNGHHNEDGVAVVVADDVDERSKLLEIFERAENMSKIINKIITATRTTPTLSKNVADEEQQSICSSAEHSFSRPDGRTNNSVAAVRDGDNQNHHQQQRQRQQQQHQQQRRAQRSVPLEQSQFEQRCTSSTCSDVRETSFEPEEEQTASHASSAFPTANVKAEAAANATATGTPNARAPVPEAPATTSLAVPASTPNIELLAAASEDVVDISYVIGDYVASDADYGGGNIDVGDANDDDDDADDAYEFVSAYDELLSDVIDLIETTTEHLISVLLLTNTGNINKQQKREEANAEKEISAVETKQKDMTVTKADEVCADRNEQLIKDKLALRGLDTMKLELRGVKGVLPTTNSTARLSDISVAPSNLIRDVRDTRVGANTQRTHAAVAGKRESLSRLNESVGKMPSTCHTYRDGSSQMAALSRLSVGDIKSTTSSALSRLTVGDNKSLSLSPRSSIGDIRSTTPSTLLRHSMGDVRSSTSTSALPRLGAVSDARSTATDSAVPRLSIGESRLATSSNSLPRHNVSDIRLPYTTTTTSSVPDFKRLSSQDSLESVLPERTRLRRQRRMLSQESVEEQPEDVMERLNKIKARISGALSEVKGVLKQYSTESEVEAVGEQLPTPEVPITATPSAEVSSSQETALEPPSDDSAPVQFRFVRKVRRRSIFKEEDEYKENESEAIIDETEKIDVQEDESNTITTIESETKKGNLMNEKPMVGTVQINDNLLCSKEQPKELPRSLAMSDVPVESGQKESDQTNKLKPENLPEPTKKKLEFLHKVHEVLNKKPESTAEAAFIETKEQVDLDKTEACDELSTSNTAKTKSEKPEEVPATKPKKKIVHKIIRTHRRASIAAVEGSKIEPAIQDVSPLASIKEQRRPSDSEAIIIKKKKKPSAKLIDADDDVALAKVKPISKVKRTTIKGAPTSASNERSATKTINQLQQNRGMPTEVKEGIEEATTAKMNEDDVDKNDNNVANNSNKDVVVPSTIILTKKEATTAVVAAAAPALVSVIQSTTTTTIATTAPKQLNIDGERVNGILASASPAHATDVAVAKAVDAAMNAKQNANAVIMATTGKTTQPKLIEQVVAGADAAATTAIKVDNSIAEINPSRLPASERNGHRSANAERLSDKLANLVGETIVTTAAATAAASVAPIKSTQDNTTTTPQSTKSDQATSALSESRTESKKPIHQPQIKIPAPGESSVNRQQHKQEPSEQQVANGVAASAADDIGGAVASTSVEPQIAQRALVGERKGEPQIAAEEAKAAPVAVTKLHEDATKVDVDLCKTNIVASGATATASDEQQENSQNDMPELKVSTGPVQPVKLGADAAISEQVPFDVPPHTDGYHVEETKKKKVIKRIVRKNSIDKAAAAGIAAIAKEKATEVKLSNLLKDKNKISDLASNLDKLVPPKKQAPKLKTEAKHENETQARTDDDADQVTSGADTDEASLASDQVTTETAEIVKPKTQRKIKKKVIIKRQKRRLSIGDTFFTQPEPEETKVPEIETIERAIAYVTDDEAHDDDVNADGESKGKDVVDKPLKSCLRLREYKVGELIMYAERYRKTQVKWKRGRVLERITSISYKLDIEGKEVPAHISYIKKWTGRKVNFGGKEYLEIDYEQVAEEERRARSYSIWNMV